MQTRTSTALMGVVTLFAVLARPAAAVWTETRITPRYAVSGNRSFKVTVKDREEGKQFQVTVEPTGKKLSPFTTGYLTVAHGDTVVAHVPVEGKWAGGKLAFWFRLSPKALAGSRFDFREQAYYAVTDAAGKPLKDEHGAPRYEQTLGGQAVWFSLEEFAAGETP